MYIHLHSHINCQHLKKCCARLQVPRVHAIHGPHEVVLVLGVGHGTKLGIDFTPISLDEDVLHPVLLLEAHWLFLASRTSNQNLWSL